MTHLILFKCHSYCIQIIAKNEFSQFFNDSLNYLQSAYLVSFRLVPLFMTYFIAGLSIVTPVVLKIHKIKPLMSYYFQFLDFTRLVNSSIFFQEHDSFIRVSFLFNFEVIIIIITISVIITIIIIITTTTTTIINMITTMIVITTVIRIITLSVVIITVLLLFLIDQC